MSDVKPVNRGRHEQGCRICRYANREDIEVSWINWANTTKLAKKYRLSRDSLYRHAHAMSLFTKRQSNVRKALERIIEQADDVEVNATAVVSAIQAYAKINSRGEWIDKVEHVTLGDLFEKMSRDELDLYAWEAKLPTWFQRQIPASPEDREPN